MKISHQNPPSFLLFLSWLLPFLLPNLPLLKEALHHRNLYRFFFPKFSFQLQLRLLLSPSTESDSPEQKIYQNDNFNSSKNRPKWRLMFFLNKGLFEYYVQRFSVTVGVTNSRNVLNYIKWIWFGYSNQPTSLENCNVPAPKPGWQAMKSTSTSITSPANILCSSKKAYHSVHRRKVRVRRSIHKTKNVRDTCYVDKLRQKFLKNRHRLGHIGGIVRKECWDLDEVTAQLVSVWTIACATVVELRNTVTASIWNHRNYKHGVWSV